MTDFTYVRSWSGFVYVAFILDVYAQRILAWHCQSTKTVDLVAIPLRMAIWERDREGHPALAGELIHAVRGRSGEVPIQQNSGAGWFMRLRTDRKGGKIERFSGRCGSSSSSRSPTAAPKS